MHVERLDMPMEKKERIDLLQPFFATLGANLRYITLGSYSTVGEINEVIGFIAENCP